MSTIWNLCMRNRWHVLEVQRVVWLVFYVCHFGCFSLCCWSSFKAIILWYYVHCSAHNVTTDLAILHVKSVTHVTKGSVTTCTCFDRLGLALNNYDKWFILGLCLGGKSYGMSFYGLIHPSYVMQSESLILAVPSPPPVQFNVYTNIP